MGAARARGKEGNAVSSCWALLWMEKWRSDLRSLSVPRSPLRRCAFCAVAIRFHTATEIVSPDTKQLATISELPTIPQNFPQARFWTTSGLPTNHK